MYADRSAIGVFQAPSIASNAVPEAFTSETVVAAAHPVISTYAFKKSAASQAVADKKY